MSPGFQLALIIGAVWVIGTLCEKYSDWAKAIAVIGIFLSAIFGLPGAAPP